MFGAGDCEPCEELEMGWFKKSTGFRPLMFGAGDCELAAIAANTASVLGTMFQTPHVRGRGLRAAPIWGVVKEYGRGFQTPHVRGRGLRGRKHHGFLHD